MSRTEHRPKTPSTKTGPLATLLALLPTAGTTAPAGFRVPAVICGVTGVFAASPA